MATALETSQYKGSDILYDVCCSVCEEDGGNTEGLFNCQKCSKYFCDECMLMHNKLHKDHVLTAKGEDENWPVTTTMMIFWSYVRSTLLKNSPCSVKTINSYFVISVFSEITSKRLHMF